MKTSPLEGVVKRSTQSAAVKETNTVSTVVNSLSREYDSSEDRGLEGKLQMLFRKGLMLESKKRGVFDAALPEC